MSARVTRDSLPADVGGDPGSVAAPELHGSAGLPRTRAGTAWVLACAAAICMLALIVFIMQNLHPVEVSFLGWHGDFPLAVALLAATSVGAVLILILGSTRIVQLRRVAIGSRRDRAPMPPPGKQSRSGPSMP